MIFSLSPNLSTTVSVPAIMKLRYFPHETPKKSLYTDRFTRANWLPANSTDSLNYGLNKREVEVS